MDRRTFVGSVAALASHVALPRHWSLQPDIALRIGTVKLDIGNGRSVKTTGYNGTTPGPLIRLREGQSVIANIANDTGDRQLVHWHGLHIPADVDGAAEEGTPFIEAHSQRSYAFTANPAGFRWYHNHIPAGRDFDKGLYTGQFGLIYIEPRDNPGAYDQEIFLTVRAWEPYLTAGDEAAEVAYKSYTINGKLLGAGDPLRVQGGQRILLHLINASATDSQRLALPGHRFHIVALDGNPVAAPADVDYMDIAPAERVTALVEMRHPGVWVLGSTDADTRKQGLGIVVEYAGQSGPPQWADPPANAQWDYTLFGHNAPSPSPDETYPMVFKSKFGGHNWPDSWTINGKSFPKTDTPTLVAGRHYRLVLDNQSGDFHPVHLHRHTFELTRVNGVPTSGVRKDTVMVPPHRQIEVDFIADNPGLTLFHCHQQLHMDYGFMMVFNYGPAK
jgi:FtsP/CotA-like multicopper oxidase with cupredoxin domain